MTPSRGAAQVTDALRAQLVEIGNDILHHGRGHGVWRDPDQVRVDLTIFRDRLTIIIDEMVKHGLVGGRS
jgi:hypothetical protein